ncbi:MAG: hypothetical protein AB7O96_18400 [Pseudobdellovibrionaceae bacterium]
MRLLADHLDELIGGDRSDDHKSTSTLRLQGTEDYSRFNRHAPSFSAKFNLKLGQVTEWQRESQDWLQRKWDRIKEDLTAPHQDQSGPAHQADTKAAHPDSHDTQKDPWHFTLEKHISARHLTNFSVGGRLRKDFERKKILYSFSSEVDWSYRDQWQTAASLSHSWQWTPSLLLSFSNEIAWQISQGTSRLSHGLSLSYLLADSQAVVISVGISSLNLHPRNGWRLISSSLNASYHHEIWNDWVYLRALGYLSFEHEHRFEGNPGVNLSLEMVL